MSDHYDAIIVLGGGRTNDGSLTDLSIQRIEKGAVLYRELKAKGVAPKVFALGGKHSTYSKAAIAFDQTGAELRRDLFIKLGVDPSDIVMVEGGRDTIGESFVCREKAKSLGFHNLLLVTSDKHMERAAFVFRRIFGKEFNFDEYGVPCGEILREDEEKRYLEVTREFFKRLPEEIPTPSDWEQWRADHQDLYDAFKRIHADYLKDGQETNQAYMGIRKDRENDKPR